MSPTVSTARSQKLAWSLGVYYHEMLPFYSPMFILLLACAVLYYRVGQFEGGSGWPWAGASILISVAIWRWLGGGWLAILLGQVGLFMAITLYRTRRKQ